MTIEFSLRRRATQARYFAALYLCLAILVLIGFYFTLPIIASETLQSVNQFERSIGSSLDTSITQNSSFARVHGFAMVVLFICLSAALFASYLLARTAFIQIELASRFMGLADALCVAGDDLNQLEKAVLLLVPKTKFFPEVSEKNLKTFLDVVKSVRG